jgi:uncharacterized damage-inducible protein DinB
MKAQGKLVGRKTEEAVISYLEELYGHQEWADAEHWRAIQAHPVALADKAIGERLLHIHQVQRAYLWIIGPRTTELVFKKLADFPAMADLKVYAQRGLSEMRETLQQTTAERMEELIEVPWFKPLKISVRHALMQAAMHSHYHRGQNATRLRELGGEPPMTDFIVWVKNGQPAARWS